ncbi:MAG: hypothetical protein KF819_18000 [Labilithrix sp.]|nr:hypothetical protein [Labilithrix sp.]
MKLSLRAVFVTTVATVVAALYACDSDGPAPIQIPPAATTPPPQATTPTPAPTPSSSTPAPRPRDPAVQPSEVTCAILQTDAGRALELDPSCVKCATQKCCALLTKCHSAATCVRFGTCERNCLETTAEGAARDACEDACTLQSGEAVAADWRAADACLFEAAPNGCACP